MKICKGHRVACVAVMAWMLSSGSMADELSARSILQRYDVSIDQLPPSTLPQAVEEKPSTVQFPFEAEKPPVIFSVRGLRQPESTGNPSIDNVIARDLKLCHRVRQAALEKGHNPIPCDGLLPEP